MIYMSNISDLREGSTKKVAGQNVIISSKENENCFIRCQSDDVSFWRCMHKAKTMNLNVEIKKSIAFAKKQNPVT